MDGLAGDFDENGVGMGARENASGDPAGLLDVDIELKRFGGAVGLEAAFGYRLAVDDDFDFDGPRIVDSTTFDVPIGFGVESAVADTFGFGCGLGSEQSGGVHGDFDFAGSV